MANEKRMIYANDAVRLLRGKCVAKSHLTETAKSTPAIICTANCIVVRKPKMYGISTRSITRIIAL